MASDLGHFRSAHHTYSATLVEVQQPEGDCLWASLFLSNSLCLIFADSCALLRWLDVVEAVLMDFDDEVFSVSVDAADHVEATVLVVSGLVAPPVASQAVRWCDCLLP